MSDTTIDLSIFKHAFADFQQKAQAAYERTAASIADAQEFGKGNVEALVEAGKIFTTHVQALTSEFVTEAKASFEAATADAKALAAVKSPSELFALQGELAKKHFDKAVAYGSKHSETLLKVAGDVAAPISNRVSLAAEKVKTAA